MLFLFRQQRRRQPDAHVLIPGPLTRTAADVVPVDPTQLVMPVGMYDFRDLDTVAVVTTALGAHSPMIALEMAMVLLEQPVVQASHVSSSAMSTFARPMANLLATFTLYDMRVSVALPDSVSPVLGAIRNTAMIVQSSRRRWRRRRSVWYCCLFLLTG